MARVTVQDCLEKIPNRFDLIMVATKRARQLATAGKEPRVPIENDKPTVLALREVAEGFVDKTILEPEKKDHAMEFADNLNEVASMSSPVLDAITGNMHDKFGH